MLQQTQVKTVIPYWERWMRELPNPQALAAAPIERVLKLWEGLGYYTRARNLHRATQGLATFPRTHEEVLALPGVGRYTAGAICSIAFNQPVPILDGNVIRVLARLFAIKLEPKSASGQKKFWQLAQDLVDEAVAVKLRANSGARVSGSCSALNQGLMELGALVCTPQKPACQICPVRTLCVAYKQNRTHAYPRKTQRPPTIARHFLVLLIRRGHSLLVRQRPEGMVNGGFWEFPNFELTGSDSERAQATAKILRRFRKPIPAHAVYRQSITRYRITLEPYLISERIKAPSGTQWRTMEEIKSLALAGAHRKIFRDLAL